MKSSCSNFVPMESIPKGQCPIFEAYYKILLVHSDYFSDLANILFVIHFFLIIM